MKYLAVKNYKRFQHYKHRSPPWIKLHAILMHDYEFLSLPEVAQRHVIFLWLLASKHNNRIPYDLTYITGAIGAKSAVDIDSLIFSNFLQLRDDNRATPETGKRRKRKQAKAVTVPQDASTSLAKRVQNSIPSRDRVETETETTPSRGGWVGRFGGAYSEASGGIAPFGEIGKHCKPLVDRDGEEKTFARWIAFCASDKRQFGAYYFAKNAGDFEPGKRQPLRVVGGLTEEQKAEKRRKEAIARGYISA